LFRRASALDTARCRAGICCSIWRCRKDNRY
jgi:hypothetical protein